MPEIQVKNNIPLPKATAELVELVEQTFAGHAHPGLWLDKFVKSWNPDAPPGKLSERVQKPAVDQAAKLSERAPLGFDIAQLRNRRTTLLNELKATSFPATTVGPLTLHLARASALENAGLCLHPIYGFAYLPGSGHKGMAHAYACEVWLPSQPNRDVAWQQICEVFGTAPSPWLKKLVQRIGVTWPKDAHAGAVVFHDAWPTTWPKLIADIVNCHHPDYYGAAENDNAHPPGDWENPVPVNFLAVDSGTQFEFAISLRRALVPRLPPGNARPPEAPPRTADAAGGACNTAGSQAEPGNQRRTESVQLATQWLAGALMHLGAGAKTNAGYGAFHINEPPTDLPTLVDDVQKTWDAAKQSKSRAEFCCTLELVTPAFLAGAKQEAEDCDLRPATLRGALRWWWRTLHAGHVDTATLRRLEAAIWGDTKLGGAVRIKLVRADGAVNSGSNPIEQFNKRNHETVGRRDKNSDYGIPNLPNPDPNKITPGVGYLAFGMDDMVRDDSGERRQRQRFCLAPGIRWNVMLTARSAGGIDAELLLEQAKAALWLLATYGGVGSKARKGFGSLAATELTSHSLAMCEASATQIRRAFDSVTQKSGMLTESSAFNQRAGEVLQEFADWTDVWAVLEQVGFAVQAFAKEHAHDVEKRALGLPRKIDRPKPGRFEPTGSFKPIYESADKLGRPPKPWEKARFASPWHIHLDKSGSGYRVRVTAFVQPTLPDEGESRRLLTAFIEFLRGDLQRRSKLKPRGSGPRPVNPTESPRSMVPHAAPMRTITRDDIVQKVAELAPSNVLFKIERASNTREYLGQFLRHAPKVAAGYQADGAKMLTEAPTGLSDGVIVLAEREGDTNRAKFLEVFGRLPPPPQKPKKGAPPRRR